MPLLNMKLRKVASPYQVGHWAHYASKGIKGNLLIGYSDRLLAVIFAGA